MAAHAEIVEVLLSMRFLAGSPLSEANIERVAQSYARMLGSVLTALIPAPQCRPQRFARLTGLSAGETSPPARRHACEENLWGLPS